MEIIAKTSNGVLIQATEQEVKTILKAVSSAPEKLEIGMKIPAIDYAGTIQKIKSFKDDYNFKNLVEKARNVNDAVTELDKAVTNANNVGQ